MYLTDLARMLDLSNVGIMTVLMVHVKNLNIKAKKATEIDFLPDKIVRHLVNRVKYVNVNVTLVPKYSSVLKYCIWLLF